MQSEFILPTLSNLHKKQYLRYAAQVLEAQNKMTTTDGQNILHYLLDKKSNYIKMEHHPKGDRMDLSTGAQYFYHCHRENFESQEHGHFHCFMRYDQIPKRIKPKALSDWDVYIDNPMTHLIAIAMNQYGAPIRLFTVNRWVSGEVWFDAEHTPYFLKKYKMNAASDGYWTVLDKWVEGMMSLFTPQIIWLQKQRDLTMQTYQQNFVNDNIYLNEDIEEISELRIDLKTQIEWIMSHEPS